MIAIGPVDGPGIMQYEDRWGWPVDSYYATPWFWLEEDVWEKVNWFQTADPYPDNIDYRSVLDNPEHPIHREIKAKVDYAGQSMIKQMNVKNMDGDIVRIVIIMGMDKSPPTYRPWSLWERTVGYQMSKFKAKRFRPIK